MVMGVKSAWRKNQKREIRNSLGRYFAILAIVALGVGFFAGLKVTKNAMVRTGDAYISDCAMYDYRLLSTLGLTESDAEAIGGIDGVRHAEGAYTADFIAESDDGTSRVIEAHSMSDNIGRISLTAGRVPYAPDECVADARAFGEADIGKTVRVSDDNDENTKNEFEYSEYKIVGLCDSVLYLNIERGTTKLAGGKINAFIYIPADGFSLPCYTEIDVIIEGGGEIFSDKYDSAVSAMAQPLEDELKKLADGRYNALVGDAQDKIDESEQKYDESLAEYEAQKTDAEKKLSDAQAELENAKTQIDKNASALAESESALTDSEKAYENGLTAYQQATAQYQSAKADAEAQLEASQNELDAAYAAARAALAEAEAAGDAAGIQAAQQTLAGLDAAGAELNQKKEASQAQYTETEARLSQTKAGLDASAQAIENARSGILSGSAALAKAKEEYADNLQKYTDSKAEADKKFAEAEKDLADAKAKIDDARAEVESIKKPDCYVLDRTANIGYSCFENDSSIVDGIAKVFPVFFFMVAALVCMTTMARMVEEQRTQIGTLKALGYSNGVIAWKYVSYSTSAALIGCVLGFFGGTKLFPWVIWKAYGMLYGFAPILYVIDWKLFILSLAVSLFCSAGVTYATCRAEMTLMPAELMRPKAPKEGKRVLLERVPFVWKRLSFLRKISIRNVFRYKKRLFMMVLGIGGCTALMLTGLGIRDSISNIAAIQFDNIMKYDFAVSFDKAKTGDDIVKFRADTKDILSEFVFICGDTLEVPTNDGMKTVNVIATGDSGIADMISMYTRTGGESVAYPPDGSVVISDKLARLAGVSAGDSVTVQLGDGERKSVRVSGVFENYVYHYMLMTPATYESLFGKECDYEAALAKSASGDVHSVSARLISDCGAANVSVIADIRERVANMMTSLDAIVILVISCAGALAFVVLFNLSNINITERIREIATIKVLGFYSGEVGAYVFRENFVLTLLGALAGVPLGIGLHRFVMSQLNFDIVKFKISITPASYAIALAVTFVFTVTVDLALRRRLDNINMVESLKAIE